MCRGELNCGLIGGKSVKEAKNMDLKIYFYCKLSICCLSLKFNQIVFCQEIATEL